jgi:SAM-dependent methyltransferase
MEPPLRPGDTGRPVPAEVYTEEYYLGCCSGADQFEASQGLAVSPVLIEVFDRLGIGPGQRCLDIGCGRGEAVFNLAKRGALALGLDYADVALGLARRMLASHPDIESRVAFVKGDAKSMPVPERSIDAAFMLDIVEHLQPWELDATLREVRRVLRPGGTLFAHTMPNLHYYRWVYPPLALWARVAQGQRPSRDPRSPYEHQMHVNEQTPAGLERALRRAGFDVELWVTGLEKWPLRPGIVDRVARAAARRRPLKTISSFHILALAR